MFFEFWVNIPWLLWFDRVLCAISVFLVLLIVIWVIPMFVNHAMAIASIHPLIRQATLMMMRIIMVTTGIFILGDVLGFASDVVFTVLGTVFGVGVSWAIKDNIANVIAGILLFVMQSYGIGDLITSKNNTFCGIITGFHLQYVTLQDQSRKESGEPVITYVPNQLLWTTVIDINYSRLNPCDLNKHQGQLGAAYLNV